MPHVEPAGADQTHVIRALVVDDSAVLRRLISNVLASDPEIEVVGTAVDGLDAIEKAGAKDFHMSFDDGGFDMTALLLTVILFILARVFRHGAAMREDLEGTV